MVHYNEAELRDKIHGCWIGKNIGGTMGTPYEETRDMLDIDGFVTEKGEILPNDDLDLQLIWLYAMEEYGPYQMSANVLGEYWLKFIPAEYNEYGTGKSNLRMGLLPPFSGEYCNEEWKNSNGAWIRSEIWACLSPGLPEIAIRYAQMDATVDHGMGEGTYAEWFTAALDSLAFTGGNIPDLIEKALSFIPEECRVARSIRLVQDAYRRGVDYRETRQLLVEDSKDLGWFQAPSNVGYVVLGLLYGEGDFKKSMIYAINCGDDTDCTGATVGAFFGILYGGSGLPQDWTAHIGDGIVTKTIDVSTIKLPRTCTDLTERIMNMIPTVLKANGLDMRFWDGPTELCFPKKYLTPQIVRQTLSMYRPYSYKAAETAYAEMFVTYESLPKLKENESVKASISIRNKFLNPRNFCFQVILPDGFSASDYEKTVHVYHGWDKGGEVRWNITITATGNIQPVNRIIVDVSCPGNAVSALVPIIILG